MLIFDLDGTLWETVDATYKAANLIVDIHSELKPISKQTISNGMGLNKIQQISNYFPYINKEDALILIDEINQKTIEIIIKDGAYIYDGVQEVIKKLSKKYKLAIVTNNTDEYVEAFFKISNLEKYFVDYIGAASKFSKTKAIKEMVERNNEIDNYYIGDTKKDMLAAEESGVTFIHAKYGFDPNLETKYYINDIKELCDLIK